MNLTPLIIIIAFLAGLTGQARDCKVVFEKAMGITRVEDSHPYWDQKSILETNEKLIGDLTTALKSRVPREAQALKDKAVLQVLLNNLISHYQRTGVALSATESERIARELTYNKRFQKLFGYNPETFPMTLDELSKHVGEMLKEGARTLQTQQRLPILPASLPVPEGYEKTARAAERLLSSPRYRNLDIEAAIQLANEPGHEADLAILREYDRVETVLEREVFSKIAPASPEGRNFPYGFDSKKEFDQFGNAFRSRVRDALKDIAESPDFYLYGSSIRGYSGRRKLGPFGQEIARKPFSGTKSDLDVAVVVSDSEFESLVREGKLPLGEKGRSRPLKPETVRELKGNLRGAASALVQTVLPELQEQAAGRSLEVDRISLSIYSRSSFERHQEEGELYLKMGGK